MNQPQRRAAATGSTIPTLKQIAHGTAHKKGDAPLFQMVGAVMNKMATLAQGSEVGRFIVRKVMVEMGASKAHQRPTVPPAVSEHFW